MIVKFVSTVFLDPDRRERLRKAREMAAEAEWLAIAAFNEEMRNSYLELKRHWETLAAEIERAERTDAALAAPASHQVADSG